MSLQKGEIGYREYTGRTSCEDEGRDQGDASISQGILIIARKSPETKRGMEQRLFHSPQKEPTLRMP